MSVGLKGYLVEFKTKLMNAFEKERHNALDFNLELLIILNQIPAVPMDWKGDTLKSYLHEACLQMVVYGILKVLFIA